MNWQARCGVIGILIVLLACSVAVQQPLNTMRYDKNSNSGLVLESAFQDKSGKESDLMFEMSLQYIGAAAMGMREAVASVLWVQADQFFHTGEYEAVLPLVRLVTWLDPHQIDVYSTGAWQLDYNLVDSHERSDRRYIPAAISLLKEGIRNNPDIYDLYFDLGWMHYMQKLKEYEGGAYWIAEATKHGAKDPNTGEDQPRPSFVDRMLAHAYEKRGLIRVPDHMIDRDKSGKPVMENETFLDKCEIQWRKNLAYEKIRAADKKKNPMAYQEVALCQKNLGLMLLRRAWRFGDMDAYKRGLDILSEIESPDPGQAIALAAAKKDYASRIASGKVPHDVYPPVDAKFQPTWKRIAPKVLQIEGTANLVPIEAYKGLGVEVYTNFYEDNSKLPPDRQAKTVNGCRVNILLQDYDYDYFKIADEQVFTWEADSKRTILVDDCMIRDGKFKAKIDMSSDPDKYPLLKDKYKLILWFNPQAAPDDVQDRIGWLGEGMTDAKYIDTKMIPGVRILKAEYILTKEDIVGKVK